MIFDFVLVVGAFAALAIFVGINSVPEALAATAFFAAVYVFAFTNGANSVRLQKRK